MNGFLPLRQRRGLLSALVLSVTCLVASAQAGTEALINNINVNTTVDEFGTGSGCSLREAVQSANSDADFGGCNSSGIYGSDVINIPPGTYSLTSSASDEDLNANADLDITESVTLIGAGPGEGSNGTSTSINGGASYNGRLIHILGGTVTLKDMTIERGHLANQGAGAGLRSEPGTTTILTNVVLGLNSADGNAGGILNRGTMTLNGSSVVNNVTLNSTQGGGGIFNDDNATLTLNDSLIMGNKAQGDRGDGGGIFNDLGASLTLDNTTVDDNTADDPNTALSGTVGSAGGGIFSVATMNIVQSTISNNTSRGNDAEGGGISASGSATITRSLVTANIAELDPDVALDTPDGGGIRFIGGQLVIADSIISNNTSEGSGGGLSLRGAATHATITNSTISGNHAGAVGGGGGGAVLRLGAALALVNTTVSGNQSGVDGGGLQVFDSTVFLANVTIANNTSNADGLIGGAGGGFATNAGGTVTMRNSVMGGNVENGAGNHDDCDGNVVSEGNNLWQHPTGCSITGIGTGNQLFVDPLLGPFAGNGGPAIGASTSAIVAGLGTHLPANNSPLIDAGNAIGCKDQNDVDLASDQRGQPRPTDGLDADGIATCDIGAVEVQGLDGIFADDFE